MVWKKSRDIARTMAIKKQSFGFVTKGDIMGYEFDWSVLITYKHLLVDGFLMTLKLSIIGIVLAFIVGSIMGLLRINKNFFVAIFASYYIEFFRNIPLIVQIFFIYFTFDILEIFPFLETVGNKLNIENHNGFFSALFALIFYTSAYIAEILRGGIQSLPKGQMEASKTLGMTSIQSLYYIILPQAMKIVCGPITSQFINLIKNSSLAMTIGVAELTFQTQEINALTFRGFEAATAVTLLYLFLTLTTSLLMVIIDRYALIRTTSISIKGV